uniref:BAR domain-containing protein n=1 Tax=Sus scrofa TaxID=9823 RepID=A0A8D1ECV9_PIG
MTRHGAWSPGWRGNRPLYEHGLCRVFFGGGAMTSGGRSRLSPAGIQDGFLPSCCRKMLKLCGETEDRLAQELIHFELQVERDVIEPLFLLAEVEIPNIQKQRKHLAKLVLDMDSSRTRYRAGSLCSFLLL